jgi:hypothetical protein
MWILAELQKLRIIVERRVCTYGMILKKKGGALRGLRINRERKFNPPQAYYLIDVVSYCIVLRPLP